MSKNGNKRQRSNGSSILLETDSPGPKAKKTIKKVKLNEGISKTKQLSQKLKGNSKLKELKTRPRSSNNHEPRICGNGKPMPSLSELEKMFDDSDSEEELQHILPCTSTPDPKVYNKSPNIDQSKRTEDFLKSPTTIKKISNKMLDFISNLPDVSVLLDHESPPTPVIPPKKRKKSDTPYIIGCKDRPQVPQKPCLSFCKGDPKYGPELNSSSEEEECPKKRARRTKIGNISKSIFNAKSDEIVSRLKEFDSEGSSDSNKTVAYQLYTPLNSCRPYSFSPLPSTSQDNETILKNDERFKESILANSLYNDSEADINVPDDIIHDNMSSDSLPKGNIPSNKHTHDNLSNDSLPKESKPSGSVFDDDIQIIEKPCETIVIDDSFEPRNIKMSSSIIEIDDSDQIIDINKPNNITSVDDESIEIIENYASGKPKSSVMIEDYYSSLDFNLPFNNFDVNEVIDVDDVIAESNAVIRKYSQTKDLNTVTLVEPNPEIININDTSLLNTNNNNVLPDIAVPEVAPLDNNSLRTQDAAQQDAEIVFDPQRTIINETRNLANTINNTGTPLRSVPHNILSDFAHLNDIMRSVYRFTQRRHTPSKRKKRHQPTSPIITPPPPEPVQEKKSAGLGDCPICMDSLSNNAMASTICGHVFCMNCIQSAIKASGKKCPTCRKALKGIGYHQLFL